LRTAAGPVRARHYRAPRPLQAIPEAQTDAVNGVAFSPAGAYVASAGSDKYLWKFDVATGKQLAQFEGHTNHRLRRPGPENSG
jgi:WD40 repeat protein